MKQRLVSLRGLAIPWTLAIPGPWPSYGLKRAGSLEGRAQGSVLLACQGAGCWVTLS